MMDNEILLQLQDEYLKTQSQKSWSGLWIKSLEVASRMLNNICKRKKLVFTADVKEDLTITAVEYVLRRYKKTPGYKIDFFITAIRYGVMHALWYRSPTQKLEEEAVKLSITERIGFQNALLITAMEMDKDKPITEKTKDKRPKRYANAETWK